MIDFPIRDNYSLDEFFDCSNLINGFVEQKWGALKMSTNSYGDQEFQTEWEPGLGWYYWLDGNSYGPFDSEEQAIAAAEHRIDMEEE